MDARDLKMHGISGRTSDGVKFSVLSVSWDSPKPDLNSLYENFRKPGQTVTKPTFSEFNATLSQTFEVIREKSGAFIRHVLSPTELFSFVAEFPAGTKETIEPLARSFFDSLQPGQPTKMPEPSRP